VNLSIHPALVIQPPVVRLSANAEIARAPSVQFSLTSIPPGADDAATSSKSLTASLSSKIPPIHWLIFKSSWITHPLRSIPITETSSLLRGDPPLRSASVLSFSWVLHLNFSLTIRATGSHVPHKSPDQIHATFMPDATQSVNRLPLGSSWSSESLSVLTSSPRFRHLISGSLALVSLILT
jgi:hypothetical protein